MTVSTLNVSTVIQETFNPCKFGGTTREHMPSRSTCSRFVYTVYLDTTSHLNALGVAAKENITSTTQNRGYVSQALKMAKLGAGLNPMKMPVLWYFGGIGEFGTQHNSFENNLTFHMSVSLPTYHAVLRLACHVVRNHWLFIRSASVNGEKPFDPQTSTLR